MNKILWFLGVLLLVVLTGCSVDIDRNPDGSLRLETSMTEQAIQTEIKLALADPRISNLSVDLENGYIQVNGEYKRQNGSGTDALSFRISLGVSDGRLTAAISNAKLNAIPIEEERVSLWNERLAEGFSKAGQKNENSTLQDVTISGEAVTMVWRVETERSQNK
jgi:N-acetylglutamate synthase/N-acetylornithine aminotransferase